ncbi:ATP-dependent DNA helicase PIF1-like protein [Tanacetum coccineum]
MTVNHRLYATFKEVCFAYGLLNGDREWTKALSEASMWALGPQLRDIFITMLLFCDVAMPLKLWETNWQALSEDILHKKQKLYKYPELQLADEQICNYCLIEIQELLRRFGIASLLLPAGRTAHSRFVIPLDLIENNMCGIKQNKQLAELMQEVQLIIWDEAPRTQRYAFEALDITHSKGKKTRDSPGLHKHIKLWNYCKVFTLTRSMRVMRIVQMGRLIIRNKNSTAGFYPWRDGTLPAKMKEGEDEPTWIDIPEKFLIKS